MSHNIIHVYYHSYAGCVQHECCKHARARLRTPAVLGPLPLSPLTWGCRLPLHKSRFTSPEISEEGGSTRRDYQSVQIQMDSGAGGSTRATHGELGVCVRVCVRAYVCACVRMLSCRCASVTPCACVQCVCVLSIQCLQRKVQDAGAKLCTLYCISTVYCILYICVYLQRKVQDAAAKKRKVDTSAQELRALEHKNLEAVMHLPLSRQARRTLSCALVLCTHVRSRDGVRSNLCATR